MLVTRSTITGAWTGVDAIGCDGGSMPGPVILEMGSADPASGNTLSWMQNGGSNAAGVLAESCVVRASFQYNIFRDSFVGVCVNEFVAGPNPSGPLHPFVFKHNRFEGMSSAGIDERGQLYSPTSPPPTTYIEEISDNTFANNSQVVHQPDTFVMAMYLRGNNVGKARRNTVVGFDVGVSLDQGAENIDFGRPGDPGQNVFDCNSAIGGAAGSDFQITNAEAPDADAGPPDADAGPPDADAGPLKLLHFAGNSWDHVPPRVRSSSEGLNGVEISWTPVPGLDFDLTNSSLVTDACPSGRIP
jgi:hypothetical protein